MSLCRMLCAHATCARRCRRACADRTYACTRRHAPECTREYTHHETTHGGLLCGVRGSRLSPCVAIVAHALRRVASHSFQGSCARESELAQRGEEGRPDGRAQSRCRCGSGERSPIAGVGGAASPGGAGVGRAGPVRARVWNEPSHGAPTARESPLRELEMCNSGIKHSSRSACSFACSAH